MRSTFRDVKDQFDETVRNILQETPAIDVESAEEIAYADLKPKYRTSIDFMYQDVVIFGSAFRKSPVVKKYYRQLTN